MNDQQIITEIFKRDINADVQEIGGESILQLDWGR